VSFFSGVKILFGFISLKRSTMTKNKNELAVFQGQQIRRFWDEEQERWYFSVVDVISVLTDSQNPAVYWRVLKKRLTDEGGNETVTKCNGLKMPAADGKMRVTDMADIEVMFRLIQSIPSPKAEPFKTLAGSGGL